MTIIFQRMTIRALVVHTALQNYTFTRKFDFFNFLTIYQNYLVEVRKTTIPD